MGTLFAAPAASAASAGPPAAAPAGGPIPPVILAIAGVDLPGAVRARRGFLGISSLRLSTDAGDALAFVVAACGPALPFPLGSEVTLSTTDPDGSNRVTRFVGDLEDCQLNFGETGWQAAYSAGDLKRRTEHLTLFGPDGSGVAAYNLEPNDPDYLQSAAGLTVGQIVASILQTPLNAASLSACGVGNYTVGSDGSYALPSDTDKDLARFDVVPDRAIRLQGQGILAQIESLIEAYLPQNCTTIDPATRSIRFRSPFDFPSTPLTFPSESGEGDPLDPTSPQLALSGCYTSYQFIGLDVDIFRASVLDKTLVPAWATTDQAKWTIDNFDQPTDSADQGAASNVTSTSVTVKSDDPTAYWTAQFWQGRGGVIELVDTSLGGTISSSETRTITSCTALSPGGTATITWDDSQPISSSVYSRYRIEGLNSPLAEVGRIYTIKGLKAPIYPRFPKPIWWSNNSSLIQISYPAVKVQWAGDGSGKPPFYEMGVNVQIDRDNKNILLAQPAVRLSAPYQNLKRGYPTTEGAGLYHDVIAAIPYMRGQLVAAAPASGYSGTAYTQYGLQRPFLQPAPDFTDRGQLANYTRLAQEKLACVQDALVEGSVVHHGWPARFDPLALGYSLSLTTPGAPSALDGLMLPVRDVEIIWPNEGPDLVVVKLSYSNRRRPFEGDDQFMHPQFAQSTLGLQDGEPIEGGVEYDFGGDDAASELPEFGELPEFVGRTKSRASTRQGRSDLRREAVRAQPQRNIKLALDGLVPERPAPMDIAQFGDFGGDPTGELLPDDTMGGM